MRRILLIANIVLLAVALQSCSRRNSYDTDFSDYGIWNEATQKILNTNFTSSLPDKATVNKYGENYYYKFKQGVFGDANFVIYINIKFPDKISFEEYLKSHTYFSTPFVSQNDTTYYAIQYSPEDVLEYTNDTVDDGMFYDFEVVSVNKDENIICCINARVWDYYFDDVLVDYLLQIQETQHIAEDRGRFSVLTDATDYDMLK